VAASEERTAPSRTVPPGFPYALDDAELDEAAAQYADALRETLRAHGASSPAHAGCERLRGHPGLL
jgi:hypothetical protein